MTSPAGLSAANQAGLRVTTDLPGGNAEILEVRNGPGQPEVHFTPAPNNGPEAAWFHFAIEPGAGQTGPIRCVLHFWENLLGAPTDARGFHPVFRTATRDWSRNSTVELETAADGRILPSFSVPSDEGRVEVALSYPYGQQQLDELLRDLHDRFTMVPIALTSERHRLSRLSNDPGTVGGSRPGIYCMARQHAAEAPGSWLLDGFLRHMAQAGGAAPLVWAVPFVDVDGILAGRTGKDAFPWDFNRAWGSKLFPRERQAELGASPMRHEIKAIQLDLRRWKERCHPRLVLDFHAPVIQHNVGIFTFIMGMQNKQPDALHAPWLKACQHELDPWMASPDFVRNGRYPSRWNTAQMQDFVNIALGLPAINFETPYGSSRDRAMTREDYRAAGAGIAAAIMAVIAQEGT